MAKRSLQASLTGIQQAKRAFALKGWTQENLAGEVNLKTRQPIWRFFTGRTVDRYIFIEVCSVLELNWREIAIAPPAEFSDSAVIAAEPRLDDIDVLVQYVRSQRQGKIQDQCGTLQLLDTSRLVDIDDIYIDVNVLEEIACDRALEIAELQSPTAQEFDRFGLGKAQKQISGTKAAETYSKLRVLGKPGAGKTAFLQHLAIQCDRKEFAANRVPIFISLRDFADESQVTGNFSLLNYIHAELLAAEISPASVLETLLRQGRVLLLLDGLDEVRDQDRHAVSQEIRRFSEKYFKNLFVATCRTAKTFKLKGFRDVEIAPFTPDQIAAFVLKWFTAFTQTNPQDEREESVQFIAKLNLPENLQFRQLAVTPLFLHLACCIFHRQEKFSSKRAEFYQQCLDLLLGKWDEAKGIERDEYQFLLPQKLRLLSQIAKETFEQGEYFFKQQAIERHISNYIRDLANAPNQTEELQLDSKVVLKAMELQHGLLVERARGIFSFSYAAFQEYFTAREIVASHNLHALEPALERLVNHITEPRWREIFLLTATMLQSADSLVQLMKQQIDALVAPDPYLQEFLAWVRHKSLVLTQPSIAATVVFDLALTPNLPVTPHLLTCTLDQSMFVDTALNKLVLECAIDSSSDFAHAYTLTNALSNALAIILDVGLHQSLQQLKDQLPDPQQEQQRFQVWWQTNHLAWVERLRAAIALHRNIPRHWHFSPQQQQILQRYYDANQLLLDCLNSDCEVTGTVRQKIEIALFLPQKELEETMAKVLIINQGTI